MLPVTLNGFYDLLPCGTLMINPFAKIGAVIHKPIPNAKICGLTADEAAALVKSTVESAYRCKTKRSGSSVAAHDIIKR